MLRRSISEPAPSPLRFRPEEARTWWPTWGHDGLMDFQLPSQPRHVSASRRQAIILACISKTYFAEPLRATRAHPLLWTTGLMAPEAYTLKSALDGWIGAESVEQIRERAAAAYNRYQKSGMKGARRLLVSGW